MVYLKMTFFFLNRHGFSLEFLVEVWSLVLQTLLLFQAIICNFPVPFFHICGPFLESPGNLLGPISIFFNVCSPIMQ